MNCVLMLYYYLQNYFFGGNKLCCHFLIRIFQLPGDLPPAVGSYHKENASFDLHESTVLRP